MNTQDTKQKCGSYNHFCSSVRKSNVTGRLPWILWLVLILLVTISGLSLNETTVSGESDIYNSTDTWIAPAGVFEVTIEAWGGGGAGNSGNAGGGGGGGAYTRGTVSVTPGEPYTVTVGAAVGSGTAGNNSSFTGDSSLQVLANGGGAGGDGNGGAAGAAGAASSTAPAHIDASFAGGSGGAGAGGGQGAQRVGGGGGGSAFNNAAGNPGQDGGSGSGGAGGSGEGNGGNGTNATGNNGNAPGAGGGGGQTAGGGGAAGRVIITYESVDFPTKVVFTTPTRTITAGSCSGSPAAITLELQDETDAPTAPLDETVIRVSSNSPSFTVYSDTSCTSELTNGDVTFSDSDTTQTIYIIDERKSDPTWTLSAEQQSGPGSLNSDNQTITVNAANVTRLVVVLPGETFTDGVGVSGSPSTQTAGSSFNISGLYATDNFYNVNESFDGSQTIDYSGPNDAPDNTSPSYTTSVNFSSGQSTTALTTTLFRAESTTITAQESGQYGFASSSLDVTTGLLGDFLVTAESPIIAGSCSSANSLQARDSWGNNRTTDSSTVNMTSSGTGITFYNGSSCDTSTSQYTLSGGTSDVFYRTERKQSGITITATKSGDIQTGTSSDITVDPAEASTLLVVLPGQGFTDGTGITGSHSFSGIRSPNATAGTSFSVDLRAVDEFNNLVDSGPNNYTGPKTLSYINSVAGPSPSGTSPSFPSTSVSFSDGSADDLSVTYFNASAGQTFRADDTATPVTGMASSTFTTQSNEITDYNVASAGPIQTAGASFNVQVIAIDNWENQLGSLYNPPSGAYTWSTTATVAPDSTAPSIGELSQSDFSNGIATKSVTLYREEADITFTAEEPSPSTVSGISNTVAVQSGSISAHPSDSFITAASTVGENEALSITVTLRDAWQNPKTGVPPANIIIYATGPANITQPSSATNSNGQTTGSIIWSTRGTYEATVEIDGLSLVQGDGSTPDTDGFLDDSHTIEVILPGADARIRGGATIRGGTTIQ